MSTILETRPDDLTEDELEELTLPPIENPDEDEDEDEDAETETA